MALISLKFEKILVTAAVIVYAGVTKIVER
jgi:hypothetical protein